MILLKGTWRKEATIARPVTDMRNNRNDATALGPEMSHLPHIILIFVQVRGTSNSSDSTNTRIDAILRQLPPHIVQVISSKLPEDLRTKFAIIVK